MNGKEPGKETPPLRFRLREKGPWRLALLKAVEALRKDRLVVFPTETFYGLGAHALRKDALEAVFRLKGRLHSLPLLCLIDGLDRLEMVVEAVPAHVEPLIPRFWPGPLTLVLPPREGLPLGLLGSSGGVGVRWSSHPVAQQLVRLLEAPIVGTSANLSGRPPPTRIEELDPCIAQGVDVILDAGRTQGALPSTVLDCTRWPPRILRPGAISCFEIASVLGTLVEEDPD